MVFANDIGESRFVFCHCSWQKTKRDSDYIRTGILGREDVDHVGVAGHPEGAPVCFSRRIG